MRVVRMAWERRERKGREKEEEADGSRKKLVTV
jgi:hypothetical protein